MLIPETNERKIKPQPRVKQDREKDLNWAKTYINRGLISEMESEILPAISKLEVKKIGWIPRKYSRDVIGTAAICELGNGTIWDSASHFRRPPRKDIRGISL